MLSNQSKYLISCVTALVLGLGSYSLFYQQPSTAKSLVNSNRLGGDFSVETVNGPFHLADYRDKIVVIYFGYTSCPDVCPTALAMLGNIIKKMPETQRQQIQPLFISVDPERDSLDKIDKYGQYFYPSLISATSDKQKIDAIVKKYGAYYKVNSPEGSDDQYFVDHTSRLYLINKQGKFADTVPHDLIAADLQTKLALLVD
ncbi:MAG: SCO family protein [Pseudomonadales bacterium]|nr:SCO family protein [Pseudomonadales bacterium]NRA15096.1 SCO family protein [Oceanospirillaceae bacterium]